MKTATILIPALLGLAASAAAAEAQVFQPGELVVSRSVYPTGTAPIPTIVPGVTQLPGGGTASADGSYPNVFANNTIDGSFGVTTPIFLDRYSAAGGSVVRLGSYAVDPAAITTSFSSKSELALNLSADGSHISFIGYQAPVNALDVSNSNTPGAPDPSNPVKSSTYRDVASVYANGALTTAPINAYSGNNGRAAITGANGLTYLAGNAGNGGNPQPAAIVNGAGSQVVGGPNLSVKTGSFSVTQINPLTGQPYAPKADKIGKDDNFRGETIFNNTLFVTKGSGGNGIDTVYQVGATGSLPTLAGGAPITVLPGFPAGLATTNTANFFPFGIFFANATTLYVADEGDGTAANAATDPNAGLEKWSLIKGLWQRDYTLQAGLELGLKYAVDGVAAALEPATDGLRNITGKVNADGTVTIYGITSTVSGSGDQGADPNRLVSITDDLAALSLPVGESFTVDATAGFAEVLRGVSFAPVPEPAGLAALAAGVLGLVGLRRRR